MKQAWLPMALSVVLLLACDKASDGPSKLQGATAAPDDTRGSHVFRETVKVILSDRQQVTIHAEGKVRVRSGREEDLANWGGESWYESSVSDRIRSVLRQQFQRFAVAEIEPATAAAANNARTQLTEVLGDTPFEIEALTIVSVELPKVYLDHLRQVEETKKEIERQLEEMERAKRKIEEDIRRENEKVDREREEMIKKREGN